MSGLRTIAIGDLVEPVKTWNPLRADGDEVFQYIDLSAVDQDSKAIVGAREVSCAEAPSRARQAVATDDVLVSTVRPNLNAVARVDAALDGATASTGFCVLRPRASLVNGNYLFQWVKSANFVADMVKKATGASYPAVSDRIIHESLIPLPPLAEQRRIAAILDQADALRAKRREALAQLDILTQSIFIEMFGDPVKNPKRWDVVRLGDHVTKMGSGSTPAGGDASYKESGISLIRSLNVHDGRFAYKNLAFIDDQQAAKLANVEVQAGDVLLNITGASVARVCAAPSDVLPARVNQHVMIIRPTREIDSVFLERMLLTAEMKSKLLQIGGAGATREAITKAQAEDLPVIRPPIATQQSFARQMSTIGDIRVRAISSLAELDTLFASLQHRAFAGQL